MNNNYGRIFEFKDLRIGTRVFINAPERFTFRDENIVLEKYIYWYNNEFIVTNPDYAAIKKEYFKYLRNFLFIDFYDELDGDK